MDVIRQKPGAISATLTVTISVPEGVSTGPGHIRQLAAAMHDRVKLFEAEADVPGYLGLVKGYEQLDDAESLVAAAEAAVAGHLERLHLRTIKLPVKRQRLNADGGLV